MIEINLLPKSYQKKSFSFSLGKTGYIAMGAAAGLILMLIGITFYQQRQLAELDKNIDRARQRAAMLQKDIRVVDALNEVKAKITNRMEAVDQLDSHRSAWVRILEDLARDVPEFVWIVRFEEKDRAKDQVQGNRKNQKKEDESAQPKNPYVRSIEIEGYAFTLNALATFMINVMRSDYFDNVELASSEDKFLDNEKKHRAHNFVISCDLHYLSDEELRGLIAQTKNEAGSSGSATRHKVLN